MVNFLISAGCVPFSLARKAGEIGTTLNNDDDDDDDNRINPRSGPILAVLIRSLLRSCLACRDDVDKEKRKYSLISGFTVDSLLMDTSLKRTPRVGPCLSLLPLFDSL